MTHIQVVKDTMKVHADKSAGPYRIKISKTSCYCQNCYSRTNLCDGWTDIKLIRGKPQQGKVLIIKLYPTLPFNSN